MSEDPTRPIRPGDYGSAGRYQGEAPRRGEAPPRRRGRRRRHRGLIITAITVVVLLILLIVADRVAAGIAENEAANQIKAQGFPVKPKVTIEGFS